MFSRFAAFYGHVWRSQFKSEDFLNFAKKEWKEGLSNFNSDILLKAIVDCREAFKMPPTLPQMVQLCKSIQKRNDFFKPHFGGKPSSKEVALHHLKQCKDHLLKNNKEKIC